MYDEMASCVCSVAVCFMNCSKHTLASCRATLSVSTSLATAGGSFLEPNSPFSGRWRVCSGER